MSAATARTATLVEARSLSKSYARGPESVHALQQVSFLLYPGEVVALLGPSGSGKSTLLNILCGWESADGGEVVWHGSDPDADPADRPWSEIAIVPQTLGLIEELSVRENVELPVRLSSDGGPAEGRRRRAAGLISGLGLAQLADRDPLETSIGEQQRTALARALVLSPQLLLADEPTGHQDAVWARGILRALRFAAGEGTCCLVATHNVEIVRFADRILGIRDGRIQPVSS
jgi:ABC-type lipoprotein export system ATPase subunit